MRPQKQHQLPPTEGSRWTENPCTLEVRPIWVSGLQLWTAISGEGRDLYTIQCHWSEHTAIQKQDHLSFWSIIQHVGPVANVYQNMTHITGLNCFSTGQKQISANTSEAKVRHWNTEKSRDFTTTNQNQGEIYQTLRETDWQNMWSLSSLTPDPSSTLISSFALSVYLIVT